MPQNTDISPGQWRSSTSVSQEQTGKDLPHALIERLVQLGFNVPPLCGSQNNVAGGVPMRLAVSKLLRSGTTSDIVIHDVLTSLKDRTPLTLLLTDLGSEDTAISSLQRFCEFLQAEISKNKLCSDFLGIGMHSHQLPLPAFQVITKSVLGNGPRYVLLDSLQMTQHRNPLVQSETDRNWSFLWRNRMSPAALIPAYGATVRTACPLLADEVTASVLPVSGLQVPLDSAWFPLRLPLPHFADGSGEVRWEQLLPALASGVELAETIVDQLCWPQAGQRADAHLNRRLALSLTGLGDLVLRRGCDPQDLASLRWLSAIVARIRRTLWHRSGMLAQSHGCLPALCSSDPSSGWDDNVRRENWRRHWRTAIEKSAVRHRNMLVLSPYCVLPSTSTRSGGYTDLLPVVAHADAWSFADVPDIGGWDLNEYKIFHRRAWAVIQGQKTEPFVAAGV